MTDELGQQFLERAQPRFAIDQSQQDVSGTVRLKLYKGNCLVAGRKSETSLYDPDLATFEEDEVYHQQDAEGFIRLNALRLKMRTIRGRKGKG